ncbi:MAG: hypothetical protein JOY78_04305 [Pseudonocardia sp.]|nr:hypothetical protein [Pseudonocardia sp.]
MPTRTARTTWNGSLERGPGRVGLPRSGVGTHEMGFPERCRRRAPAR